MFFKGRICVPLHSNTNSAFEKIPVIKTLYHSVINKLLLMLIIEKSKTS